MALLTIVISLFLERIWTSVSDARAFHWFERWVKRIRRNGDWSGTPGVVAVIGVPLLAVALIYALLAKLFVVFAFVFSVVVLLFCLGPRDLDSDVHRFLNAWERGDDADTQAYAQAIYGVTNKSYDPEALGRSVVEGILVSAHERWFGVLFWFFILGPLGALWYRLACLLREQCLRGDEEGNFKDAALMMHHILAWVPVRLTLLCYALAGSFADTFEALRNESYSWKSDWQVNNLSLLIQGGLGALQLERDLMTDETSAVDAHQVRAALGMVLRTLVVVIAVIAVITVGSWVT